MIAYVIHSGRLPCDWSQKLTMVSQSRYRGIYPEVTVFPQFTITRQLGSQVAARYRPSFPWLRAGFFILHEGNRR